MPGISRSSSAEVIADALQRARADGTNQIGEEHLFAALLANPDSSQLVGRLGEPEQAEQAAAVWAEVRQARRRGGLTAKGDADPAQWRSRALGPDPVAAYRTAADHVLETFAKGGVLDREFPLPEFKRGLMYPARQAIGFHFVDYVVHSWDVAKTLGLSTNLDPALLDVAHSVTQAVPGGDARTEPGAAFAPSVAWSGDARLDQIVAILGRSPTWQAPAAQPPAPHVPKTTRP